MLFASLISPRRIMSGILFRATLTTSICSSSSPGRPLGRRPVTRYACISSVQKPGVVQKLDRCRKTVRGIPSFLLKLPQHCLVGDFALLHSTGWYLQEVLLHGFPVLPNQEHVTHLVEGHHTHALTVLHDLPGAHGPRRKSYTINADVDYLTLEGKMAFDSRFVLRSSQRPRLILNCPGAALPTAKTKALGEAPIKIGWGIGPKKSGFVRTTLNPDSIALSQLRVYVPVHA